MATCVQRHCSRWAIGWKRTEVVVVNRRISLRTFRRSTTRTHATTMSLCTSSPAQQLCTMRTLLPPRRRGDCALRKLPSVLQVKCPAPQFGVLAGLRVRLVHGSLAPVFCDLSADAARILCHLPPPPARPLQASFIRRGPSPGG